MKLHTELYERQVLTWPAEGRHILAQYDDKSVIVYQAFRQAIARFAIAHGYFGGDFSYTRMSWVKPNFLWMMYRCGWATKPGQESVLAIRLRRSFFESLLEQAVSSVFEPRLYVTRDEWRTAVVRSSVRLQWDPDHDPAGNKTARRAIQLGLRGEVLKQYAREAIIEIIDITRFVVQQRVHASASHFAGLLTPVEHIFRPADTKVCDQLGLADIQAHHVRH